MKIGRRNCSGFIVAALMGVAGTVAAAEPGQQQAQPQGQQQGQQAQPQGQPPAPIVGSQPIGLSVQEEAIVAKGWSSKKDLIGKAVYNDKGEKVGKVEDIIIAPDKSASMAIVGAGGFVGLDKHDVAIPFQQLQMEGKKIVLPGATKDAIKSLPAFEYGR